MANLKTALIVGGGIAGMASAVRLRQMGVDVHLIDLDPEWKMYGAGITITGPTMRAYKRLEVLEEIKQRGATSTETKMHHYDGSLMFMLDEPELDEGVPGTGGIMRPILHEIMQKKVTSLNTKVSLGLTVTALENTGEGVNVVFSDDTKGHYDLVIGADGIASVVRDIAFPHMDYPKRTGQGCWRISIERPPEHTGHEFYLGHKYPAGINACSKDEVYLFMLTPHISRPNHFTDEELYTTIKQHIAPFGGNMKWIHDNLTREHWINYRPLAAALQPRSWVNGRITLVGDSVHATTPHLATGAGMAVESGIVLGDELEKNVSIETALAAYEERRYPRCADVISTSIGMGEMQLNGGSPEEMGKMLGDALHRLQEPF